MEFYDVINARRTIRDFKDECIDMEIINRIIAAGMKAPTNDHMRDWHFIIVTDEEVVCRSFASIWCCLENIFLAITAEKYAYALRIPLGEEQEYVKSILKFPDEYVMPCYIAIGKPADDAIYNEQINYTIEDKIHMNEW